MNLTSHIVSQVIEWTEMLKRIRKIYSESKHKLEASGTHSHGKSLFDNTTKEGQISPVLVKNVCSPNPP